MSENTTTHYSYRPEEVSPNAMVKAMTMLLRKILLDEHTDKVVRNSSLAKRKEEAALAAREEIRAQTLREMALKSEVPHLPNTTLQGLASHNYHLPHSHMELFFCSGLNIFKKKSLKIMYAGDWIVVLEAVCNWRQPFSLPHHLPIFEKRAKTNNEPNPKHLGTLIGLRSRMRRH